MTFSPRFSHLLALPAVAGVLDVACAIGRSQYQRDVQHHHTEVVDQLSASRAKLEQVLDERLFPVRGLAAHVDINPDVDEKVFPIFPNALESNRSAVA